MSVKKRKGRMFNMREGIGMKGYCSKCGHDMDAYENKDGVMCCIRCGTVLVWADKQAETTLGDVFMPIIILGLLLGVYAMGGK